MIKVEQLNNKNRIRFIIQHIKKTTVLALVLVTMLMFSIIVSARDNQFQLAPKEKLTQFYEAQLERFYNHVPTDVLQKHAATIAKVDKKIKDERIAGAITSKAPQFDLNYYGHIISVGILPYVDQNDPFGKELQELVSDIDRYTIDYQRLKEFNRAKFGDEMPAPTKFGKNVAGDMVKISLNGSGYNVANAVKYARAWTQNGTELRNSNYNYFAGLNDCTNFVSQVLHDANAGTIPYIHIDHWGWDFDDIDNWYYSNNGWPDRPSWTWGGAHNQYWHLAI